MASKPSFIITKHIQMVEQTIIFQRNGSATFIKFNIICVTILSNVSVPDQIKDILKNLSDNKLMMEVKKGNTGCLGILYERYKRILFTFFLHLNRDKEISEDLVQNVFIRIMKYRSSYSGDGAFKAWIFHIARNVHADHYHKNGKYSNMMVRSDDEASEIVWPTFSEEQGLEVQVLNKAFYQLDPDKREILLLSKYQNRKYKEIGEILECSEGAVKVKVHRAIQSLKEKYNDVMAKIN